MKMLLVVLLVALAMAIFMMVPISLRWGPAGHRSLDGLGCNRLPGENDGRWRARLANHHQQG